MNCNVSLPKSKNVNNNSFDCVDDGVRSLKFTGSISIKLDTVSPWSCKIFAIECAIQAPKENPAIV